MTEQDLWNRLRPWLSAYGRVSRVENRVADGFPDVNYCLGPSRPRTSWNVGGTEGWMELKVAAPSQRQGSLFLNGHKVLKSQENWHLVQAYVGGRSFIATARGGEFYLHAGKHAFVINEWTIEQAYECAALYCPMSDMKRLTTELLLRLIA